MDMKRMKIQSLLLVMLFKVIYHNHNTKAFAGFTTYFKKVNSVLQIEQSNVEIRCLLFCLFVFLQINPIPIPLNTKKSSRVFSGCCESTQQLNVDDSLFHGNSGGK